MLHELRVENLLLMERAELSLGPGLNVLTGETGAGKSLLASALDLLLGGKARAGIVREGAGEAYVEGIFALPDWLAEDERIPAGAEEVVLARRVWPDGRTRAYLCGRSATVADLRELGSRLLSFYGQHEHRRLMVTAAQLDVLDRFCGPCQAELRAGAAAAQDAVKALEARFEDLAGADGARERELDLLGFELAEIDRIAPSEVEEAQLLAERERLRHAEGLAAATQIAAEALAPSEEGLGAVALLARAADELAGAAAIDPGLAPLAERLASLRYEAEDAAAELRGHAEGMEAEPGRLEAVEERLAELARLARKHGGSIAAVLEHAQRCRRREAELRDLDASVAGVQRELEAAHSRRRELADALSAAREAAAPRLAREVLGRLAELAMAEARFEVSVRRRPDGFGRSGQDAVEFLIAPNPGLGLGPLREVASGGEMSRVMLALLSVAHSAAGGGDSQDATLVFDEIDAGIGGHTARAVGAHLRDLAQGRQVLCITHLPQVAALGERHFTIVKDTSRDPARTTVNALAGDGVLAELVRMLGADEGDRAARGHARELLRAA
ncbi:MAG TPA: DNA repair protein RecN [Solirubrobacteraceae bacterium]|nr:DNA repair protein RecN [Solirubrobacteraceae bacterium]